MGIARSQAAEEAMRAHHASADSKVIGPADMSAEPMVVFYQLSRKFVDDDRSIPEESAEVMYYALSVGHHTGVIDCFDERLSCPLDVYREVVELLPEGSGARYKLEGVLRSGEIQVDASHLPVLDEPVRETLARLEGDRADTDSEEAARAWLEGLSAALDAIRTDPAVYLMGRRRGL